MRGLLRTADDVEACCDDIGGFAAASKVVDDSKVEVSLGGFDVFVGDVEGSCELLDFAAPWETTIVNESLSERERSATRSLPFAKVCSLDSELWSWEIPLTPLSLEVARAAKKQKGRQSSAFNPFLHRHMKKILQFHLILTFVGTNKEPIGHSGSTFGLRERNLGDNGAFVNHRTAGDANRLSTMFVEFKLSVGTAFAAF